MRMGEEDDSRGSFVGLAEAADILKSGKETHGKGSAESGYQGR
jgi:hypothetical protein